MIIGGGIAAYKVLELIRRLRDAGTTVRCVLTAAATQFVTPLTVGTLSSGRVFTDLFDRDDEHDVGHIRLSREADLVVVAPATADLMARVAMGAADDLASAVLLASDKPILMAPAMNPRMWAHPATQRNRATLSGDGVQFIGPNTGAMAEAGEVGEGRMAEPTDILAAILDRFEQRDRSLVGRRFIVTSGPTHEPIDPVRYIANRSSGRQGHAIATALAAAGANVVLVTGPVALTDPPGVTTLHVQTAREMLAAVEAALPADGAVFVAAVADWRAADIADQKIKKKLGTSQPTTLNLTENPDILGTIARHPRRPTIVVGFAAETENLIENARSKLRRKNADIIIANDVSPGSGTMGGKRNRVTLLTTEGLENWPDLSKEDVARRLVQRIAERLATMGDE